MGKTLIIVESPSKIHTIKKIVGKDYEIMASYGHICDLGDTFNGFGVDVDNGYEPSYVIIEPKKGAKVKGKTKTQIVKDIKVMAKKCDLVLLASDPDREGEAIAWHLNSVIKHKNIKRIVFNEITHKAVKEALNNQREINLDLFYAQQARRILDRLVGFTLSPVLWKKIAKGLSVGRVQSPALRMIALREQEVNKFVPEEYWDVDARVKSLKDNGEYTVRLERLDGKKGRLNKGEDAEMAQSFIKSNWNRVGKISITTKKGERKAGPPFTTASLQKVGNTMLGWTADRVMRVAQSLYEAGKITYMRTDSTRLSDDAMKALQKVIKDNYGVHYYKMCQYDNTKKNVQDAHEAIRPSDFSVTEVDSNPDDHALYKLIWQRAVASQMANAITQETNVNIDIGRYGLGAKGSVIEFDGFSAVWKIDIDDMLPSISDKIQNNKLESVDIQQKFTKAPARYSEAKLVGELEKEGVGRPSTYASIIEVLLRRNYVTREGSGKGAVLKATDLGVEVSDYLGKTFEKYVSTSFTAQMESDLDKIESGEIQWNKMLDKYYPELRNEVKKVIGEKDLADRKCPKCGNDLVYRVGSYGKFIGCLGYPSCRYVEQGQAQGVGGDSSKKCPKCGKALVLKTGKYGVFYGCSGYPECRHIEKDTSVKSGYVKKNSVVAQGKCPRCGHNLVKKFSPKTKKSFVGCSNYPECNFIKLPKKKE